VRRLALLVAGALAAVVVVAASPIAPGSDADGEIRVDALFDNAAGVVQGQDVKVAGGRVGTVVAVDLTEDRLARVQMEIQPPFAPFRADARCEVRPQSLIGERFVQCDPGTPAAGPLEAEGEETPTVPVENTGAPIDLDLVFDTLRRPYRERLAILLNELGAGLTGRGEDLNRIIRNANPALADFRRLLAALNRQRAGIRAAIADTDRVLAGVAERPRSVGRFLRGAAAVSERAGRHDAALSEGVARLPGLLAEAEPALRELEGLSVDALPVLRNLRRAAPDTTRLLAELRPFARGARPTVRRLGQAAVPGRRALEAAGPFANALRRALEELEPIAPTVRELVVSLIDAGGTEGLLRFFYNSALATSRFDQTSHMLPAHFVGGECVLYEDTESEQNPACSGRFAPGVGLSTARGKGGGGRGGGRGADAPAAPTDAVPGAAPSPTPTPTGDQLGIPKLDLPAPEPIPPSSGSTVRDLLDFLLNP